MKECSYFLNNLKISQRKEITATIITIHIYVKKKLEKYAPKIIPIENKQILKIPKSKILNCCAFFSAQANIFIDFLFIKLHYNYKLLLLFCHLFIRQY